MSILIEEKNRKATPAESQVDQNLPEPLLPPNAFILFLKRIGLGEIFTQSHPRPHPLEYKKLKEAKTRNHGELQRIKAKHIRDTITFRISPPRKLGTPMKARAQMLLQEPRGPENHIFGDAGTWLLDPLDQASCRAVYQLMSEQGRTDFWMSFAMTGDMTDAMSEHKDQRTPLLGHDPDPRTGKTSPIKTPADLEEYLESAASIVRQERIGKLKRKLAHAIEPKYKNLLAKEQRKILDSQTTRATAIIDMIETDKLSWAELNTWLAQHGRTPLDEHDHALIKFFPQDNPAWKIGDMYIGDEKMVIEYSQDAFTPREDGKLENAPFCKITMRHSATGQRLIFAEKNHLPYLYPLLNSNGFWAEFDSYIIPKLGQSPYHQIQFMCKLGAPRKEITPESMETAMRAGKVDFVVDIITGKHATNKQETGSAQNYITPWLVGLTPDDLSSTVVFEPSIENIILTHTYVTHLYDLLCKCCSKPVRDVKINEVNTRGTWTKEHLPSALNDTDRQIAQLLLIQRTEWENDYHLPPSIMRTLKDIVEYGNPRTLPWQARMMLEQQAKDASEFQK